MSEHEIAGQGEFRELPLCQLDSLRFDGAGTLAPSGLNGNDAAALKLEDKTVDLGAERDVEVNSLNQLLIERYVDVRMER